MIEIAHLAPSILITLLVIGIFGVVVLTTFFSQTVDPSIQTLWFIVPVLAIIPIIFLLIRTALSDRD